MRKLMHHDHFHHALRKPSTLPVPQHELYDFARVEVAADEFGVVGKLFEGLHENCVRFHEWVAYCCDAVEDFCGGGGGRAGERADEVDVRIGSLRAFV
jgi:hypothetical protein